MKWLFASAALAATFLCAQADAQTTNARVVQSCSVTQNAPVGTPGQLTVDVNGNLCTTGGSSGGASGTPTQATVSVLTSSTTVLAAAAANNFIKLCVASTAANGVWVRWDGGTATQAAPAEYIPPGQCDAWIKSSGFLLTSQINAIASSAVSVSLIYN